MFSLLRPLRCLTLLVTFPLLAAGPALTLRTGSDPRWRTVEISDGVDMAVVPVQVWEFAEFVRATGHAADAGTLSLGREGWKARGHTWRDPGFSQAEDHPVVGVSWHDAVAYCEWLTAQHRASGRIGWLHRYRLPTDQEWDRALALTYTMQAAARVGTALPRYPWGDAWPPPRGAGNFGGEEAGAADFWPAGWDCLKGYRDDYLGTAPVWVDAFLEDALILGLHGNVWQWTSSDYSRAANAPELRERYPFLDRETDDTGKPSKIIRGGCWNDFYPGLLELRCRGAREPANRNTGLGFRVVLERDLKCEQ